MGSTENAGLLFGFTALRAEDYFNLSVYTAFRGHPYKLFLTRCFTDVRKYFFSVIVLLKYGMGCLVTLILRVLIVLSADLLVLI